MYVDVEYAKINTHEKGQKLPPVKWSVTILGYDVTENWKAYYSREMKYQHPVEFKFDLWDNEGKPTVANHYLVSLIKNFKPSKDAKSLKEGLACILSRRIEINSSFLIDPYEGRYWA